MKSLHWISAFALLGLASPAWADDPPALVGRIATVQGSVSYHANGGGDWEQAVPNDPVSGGNAVFTGPDGLARLDIGPAFAILRQNSETDIAQMDDSSTVLRLDKGTVDLRMAAWPWPEGFAVSTPQGLVRLDGQGLYRVSLAEDGSSSRIDVWEGSALLSDGRLRLVAGQEATFVGNGYTVAQTPPEPADLRQAMLAEPPRYVSAGMTGYEDLDRYGTWQDLPGYGPVWTPAVSPGWEPYRYGHWLWVDPWGWTWVDDAPWGFAPFHYGRWAMLNDRWSWVPGPYERQPVYAPALVIFSGEPNHRDHGRDPGTRWAPLQPGDNFHPSYHASEEHLQRLNAMPQHPWPQHPEAQRGWQGQSQGQPVVVHPGPGPGPESPRAVEPRVIEPRVIEPRVVEPGHLPQRPQEQPRVMEPPRQELPRAVEPQRVVEPQRLPQRPPEQPRVVEPQRQEPPRAVEPQRVVEPQRLPQRQEPPRVIEPQRAPEPARVVEPARPPAHTEPQHAAEAPHPADKPHSHPNEEPDRR